MTTLIFTKINLISKIDALLSDQKWAHINLNATLFILFLGKASSKLERKSDKFLAIYTFFREKIQTKTGNKRKYPLL